MRIQCESNAHRSCPHCIVQDRIHACTLTSSGHTSAQLPWRRRQNFILASYHIASRVKQIRGTQCVAQRSPLEVDTSVHATPFLVLTCNAQLCDPVWNHLWKWIGINQDRIRIGRMRIQRGCAQTGFDPVHCALGDQCVQSLYLYTRMNVYTRVSDYSLRIFSL